MKTYNKSVMVLLMLIVFVSLCSNFATPISIGNFANNTDIYKESFSLFLNVSSFDEGGVCTLTKTIDEGTPTTLFTSDYIGIDRYNDYSMYLNFNNINYTYCYQEFSNVSTSCGGLNSGVYGFELKSGSSINNEAYWNDGDWTTSTRANFPHANMTINYTIPEFVNKNNSRWKLGLVSSNISLKIPLSCWNRTDNKLLLRIYTNAAVVAARCTEYDGAMNQFYYNAAYTNVSEEAMNWSMDKIKEIVSDTQIDINNIEETPGIIGNALSFDGDSGYIDLGSDVIPLGDKTVSVWVQANTRGENYYGRVIDNGKFKIFCNKYDPRSIKFNYGGADSIIDPIHTICGGGPDWYHVAVVYSDDYAKMYINGVLTVEGNIDGEMGGTTNTYIGNRADDTLTWHGSIDELKIFNYSMTQSQIQDLYERNSFFYLDDNTSVENVFDETMNGTIVGNPKIVDGRISESKALNFDGIDDYINITDGNLTNLNAVSFTVAGWIKPNFATGTHYNYILGDQSYKYSNPALFVTNTGRPYFRVLWNRDSTSYSRDSIGSDGDIQNNTWAHLAGVYNLLDNGNYTVQLFVNGVPKTLSAESTSPANLFYDWEIGRGENNNVNYYTNGSIQDVGIYTKALNTSEIQTLFLDNSSINRYKLYQINETTNLTIDTEYRYDLSCDYDDYGISYSLTDSLYLETNTGIDNCSNYLMQTLNISTRYIEDNALTDSTIEGHFWIYTTDENIRKEYNLTWENGNSYGVCLSPNKTRFNLSANIFYYNDFEERTYYLNDLTVSNTTQNINLYFQNLTTQTLFYVIDENDDYIKNAYITVRRHDIGTNTDTTLYILKTDDDGSAVANLILNTEYYSFIITYLGDIVFESSPTLILTSPKTFRVNLGTDFYDNYQQVLNVEGEVSFVNATKTFSFTFNDLGGVSTVGCLEVTKHVGSLDTLVNKTCLTTSSGTINIQITGVGTSTFVGQGYVKIGGIKYVIDQLSYNFNETYKEWGDEGLFAVFFFLLTVTMVGVSMGSPAIAIALLAIGLILSVAMSIFMFSSEYVITYVILAGIAMYFTSRRTR